MADQITEKVLKAAHKANQELGKTEEGRKSLSSDIVGEPVLNKYLEVEDLSEENIRDTLTGAFNRRYLESVVGGLLKEKKLFAFMMCDLDNFSEYNDEYGHDIGDAALKGFVVTVDDAIKVGRPQGKEDFLARWGGEEFAVVLRNINDVGKALEIGERIRQKVESSFFSGGNGKKLKMTVSLGVTLSSPEDNVESITKRADIALYNAKKGGRNRTESI